MMMMMTIIIKSRRRIKKNYFSIEKMDHFNKSIISFLSREGNDDHLLLVFSHT